MSNNYTEPMHCMVIDDDENIRNLISTFLKKRGHTVYSFGSAPEALAQIVSCQPDIVLVDWMMPGMDGISFLGELDRHSVHFRPVTIMITSKSDDSAVQCAIDRGFDDFIHKPFTLTALTVRLSVAEKHAINRRQLLDLQKEAEDRFNYLQTLSRNICAGILIIDSESHQILYCNQFASELIGLPIDQIAGQVCHQFVCPRERGACPISDLHMNINRRQAVLLTGDKKERTIIKTAENTTYNGKPAILETFIDAGELSHAQQEMRAFSQNLESLAESWAQRFLQKMEENPADTQTAEVAREIGGCLLCADSSIRLVDQYWNMARDLIQVPENLTAPDRQKYKAIISGMDEALCAAANNLSRTGEVLRWESASVE